MCHVYGQLGGLCLIWLFDMNTLVSNYELNNNNNNNNNKYYFFIIIYYYHYYFIIIIITLIYYHWKIIYLSDK